MQSNPRILVNLLVILVNTGKFTSGVSKFTSKTNQKEPQVKGGWTPVLLVNHGNHRDHLVSDATDAGLLLVSL